MAESTRETRIARYIGLYSAESTITHAKSSLRLFLGSALGRKLTADALEAAGERYFSEKRDYQTDVETFFKSIRQYAPKSINMILSFTKGFLGRNGVKFDEYYWRDLKGKHKGLKENRPLTEDQAPTPEILRKILQFHAPARKSFRPRCEQLWNEARRIATTETVGHRTRQRTGTNTHSERIHQERPCQTFVSQQGSRRRAQRMAQSSRQMVAGCQPKITHLSERC